MQIPKKHKTTFIICTVLILLLACNPFVAPLPPVEATVSPMPTLTSTATQTPSPTKTPVPTQTPLPEHCFGLFVKTMFVELNGGLSHGETRYLPAYNETVFKITCTDGEVYLDRIAVSDMPTNAKLEIGELSCAPQKFAKLVDILATVVNDVCSYEPQQQYSYTEQELPDISGYTELTEPLDFTDDAGIVIGRLSHANGVTKIENFLENDAIFVIMEHNVKGYDLVSTIAKKTFTVGLADVEGIIYYTLTVE